MAIIFFVWLNAISCEKLMQFPIVFGDGDASIRSTSVINPGTAKYIKIY